MKNKPYASIIIPNWNGKHLLEACLESLRQQTIKQFEVLIVDNGSNDGSVQYVKSYFPEYTCIELEKNYGFAPAVNIGIKHAKSENIILLNNDTKVDRYCIEHLIQSAKRHSDVGIIAAKMLNYYHPDIIDSVGDYIDVVGHASNIGLGEKDDPTKYKEGFIFLATGGGSLIKRHVFEKIGYLDDDYFAYHEDVDFCFRAQLAGYKVWLEPKAVIYHIHKATSSKKPHLLEYLQFRNMTQTVIKNFPAGLLLHQHNWLKVILVNLNTVRFLALKGYLIPALKAELYILTHLVILLKKRAKIQRLKVVSDEYILDQVREKKIKVPLFGEL